MEYETLSARLRQQKEEMEQVIQNAHFTEMQTAVMQELYARLCDYTQEHLTAIQHSAEEQMHHEFQNHQHFDVVTALIKKEDIIRVQNALQPVCEEELGLFLDCPYEKVLEICGKQNFSYTADAVISGKLRQIRFNLVHDSRYTEAERLVCRLASQYDRKAPYIYSPYARKYARIVLKDKENLNIKDITDFQVSGIDLPPEHICTTVDYVLMWNLVFTEQPLFHTLGAGSFDIPSDEILVSPYFKSLQYVRKFIGVKENEYPLLHLGNGEHVCFLRTKHDLYFSSDTDLSDAGCDSVTILNGSIPSDIITFRNHYQPRLCTPERLRSAADIRYVLSSFSPNPYGVVIQEQFDLERKEQLGDIQTIRNYAQEYSYYYAFQTERMEGEHTLLTRFRHSSLNCILYFSGGYMTEDYANYVLEYLNDTYPEFYWQGVLR